MIASRFHISVSSRRLVLLRHLLGLLRPLLQLVGADFGLLLSGLVAVAAWYTHIRTNVATLVRSNMIPEHNFRIRDTTRARRHIKNKCRSICQKHAGTNGRTSVRIHDRTEAGPRVQEKQTPDCQIKCKSTCQEHMPENMSEHLPECQNCCQSKCQNNVSSVCQDSLPLLPSS